MLDLLVTSFERHESYPTATQDSQHFSLEQIRDFMRHHLSRISTEFTFGQYTSVHSIAEHCFKTCHPVTISDLTCPNGHVVNRHWPPTSNCEIIIFGHPGMSLQDCLDNFTDPTASNCPTCDTCLFRTTSFVQLPPVLVFDLETCVPFLSSVL